MAARRFFTDPSLIKDGKAYLPKEEEHHALDVLRLSIGDQVILIDGTGWQYITEVESIKPLVFNITSKEKPESSNEITLAFSLTKGKKPDTTVRQLTEIGVSRIVIFTSRYSVPALKGEKEEKKVERWRKIASEAAKQSGRADLPEILLSDFDGLLQTLEMPILVMYEGGGKPLLKCLEPSQKKLSVVIGPEGGFSPEEIKKLEGGGAEICSLGRTVLRAETAAIFSASVVSAVLSRE